MLSNTTEYISHFAHNLFMALTIFLFMAETWAETPDIFDIDDDVHLGNDMDLSPHSDSPSSPVPDAIAKNGDLFAVSDDNAADHDPSHGLGPLPVPVGHHDGPLAGRQRAIAVVHSAMLIIQAETGSA